MGDFFGMTKDALLDALATARHTIQDAMQDQAQARETIQALMRPVIPDLDLLKEDLQTATQRLADGEATLRDLLLTWYLTTGERKAQDYGEVKQTMAVTYDARDALAWALEHRLFLALDTKSFETYCLGCAPEQLPPGVTLASSLKPYLNRKTLTEGTQL